METKYCAGTRNGEPCNKPIVKVCFAEYVYKKGCGEKTLYGCSYSCHKTIKVPNKKAEREKKMIEQELNGALPISDDYITLPKRSREEIRQEAKESKEIAEKRREIERGLKKRNKHIVYWHRDNSTHNNSKTT